MSLVTFERAYVLQRLGVADLNRSIKTCRRNETFVGCQRDRIYAVPVIGLDTCLKESNRMSKTPHSYDDFAAARQLKCVSAELQIIGSVDDSKLVLTSMKSNFFRRFRINDSDLLAIA